MKKVSLKIFLTILCVLMCVTLFALFTSAEGEKCAVYLVDDGVVIESMLVDKDSVLSLPEKSCDVGSYKGWFTDDGTFYEAGSSVTVSNDMSFNLAKGGSVSLTGGLTNALAKGYSYVKLNTNMTIENSLTLSDTLVYIDLGGNTLKLISDDNGFIGKDSGIIFANGKVEYTYTGDDAIYMVNSLIQIAPQSSANNLTFVVKSDAEIVSNVGFLIVDKDISKFDGLEMNVYGKITSDRLIRTNGMKNGSVNFYDGSSYVTECEYFFDDFGVNTGDRIITLTIYGGSFTLDSTSGFAKDESRYKTILVENSKPTFSKDIKSFFANGNYSFSWTGSAYQYLKCAHDGPIVIKPDVSSCTEAVTVTHQCSYCNAQYTSYLANGIGHSYTISLVNDIINTEEETLAGCYAYSCQSCGYEYNKYIYPDPSSVYVTVGIIKRGEKQYPRVPALDLYTLEGTKLISFSTAFIETTLGVTQDDIFYVEIPLGTTEVLGDYRNSTASGVFRENSFIKELQLPRSLVNINQYAFSLMEKLETIHGLEYISGTISNYAFAQTADSPLIIEHMVLNAKTIGERSFQNIRMKTLTFGSNTHSVGNGAFHLEAHQSMLKEIFMEGYKGNEGVGATQAFNSVLRKSMNGSNQQFANMSIVYTGHAYETTIVEASCNQAGSEVEICSRCNDTIVKSEVPMLPHDFESKHTHVNGLSCPHCKMVESSCRVRGYYAPICKACSYVDLDNVAYMPFDYNKHIYTSSEKIICSGFICETPYYTLGVCVCGAVEEDKWENREYHDPLSSAGLHDWDTKNTEITIQPNCSKENGYGQEIQTCKLCGKTKKVAIPPTGRHSFGEVVIVDPGTCETKGIGERTCTICGDKRQSEIEGQHVTEGDGEIILEPTETSPGQKRFFCTICQSTVIEEIARLPVSNTDQIPVAVIVLIVIGAILLLAGIGLTVYFTFFKKKNASTGYKYKFNTLK